MPNYLGTLTPTTIVKDSSKSFADYDVVFSIDNKPIYLGIDNRDKLQSREIFRIYSIVDKNLEVIGYESSNKWWHKVLGGNLIAKTPNGEIVSAVNHISFWKWEYYLNGNKVILKSSNSHLYQLYKSKSFQIKSDIISGKYAFEMQENSQILGIMCFTYFSYVFDSTNVSI